VPPSRHRSLTALGLVIILAMGAVPLSANAAAAPTTAQIDAKRQQAAEARLALDKMRSDLAAGMSRYSKVSNDLARTREEIAVNGARLKTIELSLAGEQTQLKNRASYMYRTKTGDLVEVLFGASSFGEFAQRLDALTEIAERDAGLILHMKEDRAESERLRRGLKDREARQVVLRNQADAHRASVQSELDKEQRFIASLSAEVADLVAKQERAQAAARVSSPSPSHGVSAPTGGGGLVRATVEGHGGSYLVMSGQPRKYRATGNTVNGETSVYSNEDNGTATASGRPFNDRELTCAHPSLPFGTLLAVSYGGNGVIVEVTDRGPYTGGRVLDLSTRAGEALGIDGIGDIQADVVEPAQ
jgi:rare lipoprotein A (peptidoglycan hydrolase)